MALTVEEARAFSGKLDAYKDARRRILEKWNAQCNRRLTLDLCKDGCPPKLSEMLEAAYSFLQQHGVINFGILERAHEVDAPEQQQQQEGQSEAEEKAQPAKLTKRRLLEQLYVILRTADFQVMTEKKIRAQLAADLGHDMDPYKGLIRKHVQHIVEHMDERETVAPLPFSDDDEAAAGDGGDGKKKGAKAGSGRGQKDQEAKKEQPLDVLVVGAGLAGLLAANVLQHNGLKVVVLEAQKHVGGRLAKLCSPAADTAAAAADATGAAAAADSVPAAFGAVSLALSASAAPAEGDAAATTAGEEGGSWPSGASVLATLCRQLGIELLPYNGTAGATATVRPRLLERRRSSASAAAAAEEGELGPDVVPVDEDVQAEAEGLFAEILADLRRRLDAAVEEDAGPSTASPGAPASLGAALEAALKELEGPAPPAASADAGTGAAKAEAEAGVKRAAEDAGAGSDKIDGTAGEGEAEARPSKRSRAEGSEEAGAEENGGGKGAAGKEETMAEADANNRSGDSEPEGSAAAERDGEKDGEKGQARHGEGAAAAEASAAPKRVREAVLRALRINVLPLLELHLGAPLASVSLSQLRLLPRHLPGLPLTLPEPGGAAAATEPRPQAVLPRSGLRQIVDALATGLDVRTGVVVTAVAAPAAGGVKVSAEGGASFTASAVVLAVPHEVLRSGAITLDPPVPLYRTAAAARVSGGSAVSVSLELPPACSSLLAALSGGRDGSEEAGALRPFLVAGEASPSAPGTSAPAEGGFLFCPPSAAPGADVPVLVVAHLVCGLDKAFSLSDDELQRQTLAALRAAAAAARPAATDADAHQALSDAAGSCRVVRWGAAAATSAAAGSGVSKAATMAARGAACAFLTAGPTSDPRDMVILAAAYKGRVFFAGDHTAPQQLLAGLPAALAASGVREAARVLKALKGGGPGPGAAGNKKGAKAGADVALEVGDEEPVSKAVAEAEAAVAKAAAAAKKAAAEAAAAAKAAAAGDGKSKAKAKVVRMKKTPLDSDEEAEEEEGKKTAGGKDKAGGRSAEQETKESGKVGGGKGSGKEAAKAKPAQGKDKKAKKGKGRDEEDEADEASGSGSDEGKDDESGSEQEDSEAEDGTDEEGGKKAAKKGRKDKASGAAATRKAAQGGAKDKKASKAGKRAGDEDDEEEEDLEEEEEDASAKGRAKKASKRKRAGGGDSSGEEADGSDEGREGGKRAKGHGRRGERERTEEEAQLGILDKQRKQQALAKLQADRKDLKVVYKAMMAAGNGNLGPLREQLNTCAGLEAKQTMISALQGATLPVLQRLANDASVLMWLGDMLMELCDESSAEHLVLAELRLLDRLPLPADALALVLAAGAAGDAAGGGSGEAEASAALASAGGVVPAVRALVAAVKERCAAHRSKDVKKLAALITANWERRAAGGSAASRGAAATPHAAGAGAAPGVGPAGSAARPPMFNPKDLVSLRATPPPAPTVPTALAQAARRATPPPPGLPGAPKATQSNGTGADQQPQSQSQQQPAAVEVVVAVDPSLEAKLLAAKAAAEAARQEAALAAQRRAEVQQETQSGPAGRSSALPEIATFEDYKRVEQGSGATGAGGSAAAGKHKDSSGGSGKAHKSGSGGGGGSGGSDKGAGGSSQAGLEALKEEVVEYTKQLLRRAHKSGKISTASYRLILDKATRKVFETLGPSSVPSHHHHHHGDGKGREKDLLGSKRREKISKLVEQYVQKLGQPDAAAAAGDGRAAGTAGPGAQAQAAAVAAGPTTAGSGMGAGAQSAGEGNGARMTATQPPVSAPLPPPPPPALQPALMQPQQPAVMLGGFGPGGGIGAATGMGLSGIGGHGTPPPPPPPLPPPPPPQPQAMPQERYGGGGGGGMLLPPGLM